MSTISWFLYFFRLICRSRYNTSFHWKPNISISISASTYTSISKIQSSLSSYIYINTIHFTLSSLPSKHSKHSNSNPQRTAPYARDSTHRTPRIMRCQSNPIQSVCITSYHITSHSPPLPSSRLVSRDKTRQHAFREGS